MDGIRYFRDQQGWTQQQLADASGCSAPEISRWETGERVPKLEQLIRLAYALDVEPADIIQYGSRVGKTRFIMVHAIASATDWAGEAFLPKNERYAVSLPVQIPEMDEKDTKRRLIAVEVGDNHIDRKYPKGSIVVVLKFVTNLSQELTKNKRYLVQRINEEGRFQLALMRLEEGADGQPWLTYDTNDPSLQRSMRYSSANPAIKILGRVIRGIIDD